MENDGPTNVRLGELVDALSHNTVRILAILVNHDMAGRFCREDLTSAFEICAISSFGKFDNDPHTHTPTGEGNHLDNNGSIACFLEVPPFKLLCELEQSSLGLASDENDLATLRVHILEAIKLMATASLKRPRSSGERTVLSCDWSMEKSLLCFRETLLPEPDFSVSLAGVLSHSWTVGLRSGTRELGKGGLDLRPVQWVTIDHMHLWGREDRDYVGDDVCGWDIVVVLARHVGSSICDLKHGNSIVNQHWVITPTKISYTHLLGFQCMPVA